MSLEKGSRITLGCFALVMMLAYILASLKAFDMSQYIMPITGFIMALLMIFEFGIIGYFTSRKYRSIDFKDFIVWLGMGIAMILIFNSIIMLPNIGGWILNTIPSVADFMGKASTFVAVMGGLFVIVGMILPEFKH